MPGSVHIMQQVNTLMSLKKNKEIRYSHTQISIGFLQVIC